jgi:hypothetical protein
MISRCWGHRGAAGVQGEAELMADVLPAQPLQDGLCGGLAAQRADERVQLPVQLGVAQQVAGPDGLLHRGADAAQAVAVVVGQPGGRLRRAQALQGHPDLDDLDGLGERDGPHPGAPVLDAFDETFGREFQERGADAPAAGPEPLGQVRFDQALVGGELAVRDGVTDGGDDGGRPDAFRHCGHRSQLAVCGCSAGRGARFGRVRGPKMASTTAPNSHVPAMKMNTLW